MTSPQILLFLLFGAVFGLLLWGRWRYDLVAFSALLVAAALGLVPKDQVFSGFGHPATLIVALVLVVSAGLVRSGAVYLITRTLVDAARPLGAHIAIMGGIGALLSAFMNNVAALALLMPVDIQTARKAGRAPGLSLMPLSFATILGGMATLIGTPPNIIIAAYREQSLGTAYSMFDFAPVGGIVALAGLAFVALLGWRLIPRRDDGNPRQGGFETSGYLAELTVPPDARLIGQRVAELDAAAESADVAVLGLIRDGKRRYGAQRNTALAAGDTLVIEATPQALDEFRAALTLDFAEPTRQQRLTAEGAGLAKIEVVVPEGARIAGKTAQSVGLNWRRQSLLMGISRQGRGIRSQVRHTRIRAGDILLLLVPQGHETEVADWLGCLPLAERGLAVTRDRMVWWAIFMFAAAVAAAALGILYLPVALGLVAVGYVLIGILPISEIYDHVAWPVVVLLGAMIPLGAALESTGGTQLIASALIDLTASLPAWAVLTVLMLVTMTLSDVLNNTATTIVAAPVGLQIAQTLGVSPDPFLMAVAVAASCAFLTPIGHKNNTLILGPGGYGFGDYWRTGLPLEILVVAVAIPAIMWIWPL